MSSSFSYEAGFKAGVIDFQNGERENPNYLAQETSVEYAEGYFAGWKREKEKYESQLSYSFISKLC